MIGPAATAGFTDPPPTGPDNMIDAPIAAATMRGAVGARFGRRPLATTSTTPMSAKVAAPLAANAVQSFTPAADLGAPSNAAFRPGVPNHHHTSSDAPTAPVSC